MVVVSLVTAISTDDRKLNSWLKRTSEVGRHSRLKVIRGILSLSLPSPRAGLEVAVSQQRLLLVAWLQLLSSALFLNTFFLAVKGASRSYDESWRVVDLKEECRRLGLTGLTVGGNKKQGGSA
jgi:hypothetical protein